MRLNALQLLQLLRLEVVNSNVSIPVSTGNVPSIRAHLQTTNGLLDVLVSAHKDLVELRAVSVALNLTSLFVSVLWFGFEHFEILALNFVTIVHEDDLAHVLAVGVAKETLLDRLSIARGERCLVDEVPEANRSVARAGHEPSEAFLVGFGYFRPHLLQPKRKPSVDPLNVVDGPVVRKESAVYLELFLIADVPQEHHLVRVDGQDLLALGVADEGCHICVLEGLFIRYLYFPDA